MFGLFQSPSARANPEYVIANEVSSLILKPRKSVVVVFNAGTPEKPNLRMLRPAVVPVNSAGKLVWFKDDSWLSQPIQSSDRFIIEKDMFGAVVRKQFLLQGCWPQKGELIESSMGVAWMASCSEEITKTINAKINRVSYDEARGSVASRFYNYKFKKDNNMLFEEVSLKSSPDVVIARDSDLYIRSDVKNFFTLNFSSADIESKLIEKRIDSLAALASLGFYLKVLFFKLTLDLRTDVAFFESSANIPMVMTLPVTASKRLHRKSGVLYSFQLGDAVSTTALKVDMPILKDKSIDGNFIQPGLFFCRDICQYELVVPMAGKQLKMRISMNRSLVEQGLFPWFVQDISAIQETMGWSLRRDLDLTRRVGLYFEVSKLPKGSHPWDFWISF